MNRAWMVAVAAAMEGRVESLKHQAHALVTVFTYNKTGVPACVMARAGRVATAAFDAVGVGVRWVEGMQLGGPREVTAREMPSVVFDGQAPAGFAPRAMAFTNVGGRADANVNVFYNRVAGFEDRVYMPEFLGNVLAHELTHALQGVARHSLEGPMKAVWSARAYAEMVRGPLAFTDEDVELFRARFKQEMSPAPTLVPIR